MLGAGGTGEVETCGCWRDCSSDHAAARSRTFLSLSSPTPKVGAQGSCPICTSDATG